MQLSIGLFGLIWSRLDWDTSKGNIRKMRILKWFSMLFQFVGIVWGQENISTICIYIYLWLYIIYIYIKLYSIYIITIYILIIYIILYYITLHYIILYYIIYMFVYIYICTCVCLCIYIHICVYLYVYIYIYFLNVPTICFKDFCPTFHLSCLKYGQLAGRALSWWLGAAL